jgi:hypothetical protein
MSSRRIFTSILVTLLTVVGGSQLSASQWEFTLIAEAWATTAPGTAMTFLTLDAPAYSSGRVVFAGTHASLVEGVWEWRDGQLGTVLSSSALTFRGLPDVSGSMRSFSANGVVYSRDGGGSIVPIVDTMTPVPGGAGNFASFRWTSTDGASVAFTANGPGNGNATGVYSVPAGGGTVVKIADLNDGFSSFSRPLAASAGFVVFTAYDPQINPGVYRARVNGTGMTTVIDRNTPIPVPGVVGTFVAGTLHSIAPAVSGDTAFVYGGNGDVRGIFRKRGAGGLEPVVTSLDSPPGTPDTFADFYAFSASGNDVAFIGAGFVGSDIPRGLFVILNGQLEKVIDGSDTINGRPFRSMGLLPKGFDGRSVAFYVFLDDTNVDGIVLARCLDCFSVFLDGFESGSTSRWSGIAP